MVGRQIVGQRRLALVRQLAGGIDVGEIGAERTPRRVDEAVGRRQQRTDRDDIGNEQQHAVAAHAPARDKAPRSDRRQHACEPRRMPLRKR